MSGGTNFEQGLNEVIDRWNARQVQVADRLRGMHYVYDPHRPVEERYVGSSFQFLMPGATPAMMMQVVEPVA